MLTSIEIRSWLANAICIVSLLRYDRQWLECKPWPVSSPITGIVYPPVEWLCRTVAACVKLCEPLMRACRGVTADEARIAAYKYNSGTGIVFLFDAASGALMRYFGSRGSARGCIGGGFGIALVSLLRFSFPHLGARVVQWDVGVCNTSLSTVML